MKVQLGEGEGEGKGEGGSNTPMPPGAGTEVGGYLKITARNGIATQ